MMKKTFWIVVFLLAAFLVSAQTGRAGNKGMDWLNAMEYTPRIFASREGGSVYVLFDYGNEFSLRKITDSGVLQEKKDRLMYNVDMKYWLYGKYFIALQYNRLYVFDLDTLITNKNITTLTDLQNIQRMMTRPIPPIDKVSCALVNNDRLVFASGKDIKQYDFKSGKHETLMTLTGGSEIVYFFPATARQPGSSVEPPQLIKSFKAEKEKVSAYLTKFDYAQRTKGQETWDDFFRGIEPDSLSAETQLAEAQLNNVADGIVEKYDLKEYFREQWFRDQKFPGSLVSGNPSVTSIFDNKSGLLSKYRQSKSDFEKYYKDQLDTVLKGDDEFDGMIKAVFGRYCNGSGISRNMSSFVHIPGYPAIEERYKTDKKELFEQTRREAITSAFGAMDKVTINEQDYSLKAYEDIKKAKKAYDEQLKTLNISLDYKKDGKSFRGKLNTTSPDDYIANKVKLPGGIGTNDQITKSFGYITAYIQLFDYLNNYKDTISPSGGGRDVQTAIENSKNSLLGQIAERITQEDKKINEELLDIFIADDAIKRFKAAHDKFVELNKIANQNDLKPFVEPDETVEDAYLTQFYLSINTLSDS